jgi:hypothetical protein
MTRFENWGAMLGTKVIIRSDNDEPLVTGELVEFDNDKIPIIRIQDGDSTKEIMSMGVMIPYSEEIEAMLKGLSFRRQWDILSAISLGIQISRGRRR